MYRTTSKSLDKRLSKEEQLVYMKCFVPKSLADLRRITSLENTLLESSLNNLVAMGFLREMTNTVPTSVPQRPVTLHEDALSSAKRDLCRDLERILGTQSTSFVQNVQATTSIAELKGTVRKILVKLRLTVSQSAAKEFEASLQTLLEEV